MEKAFASKADLAAKKITFTRLADCAYAYTAEGDPNSGVVIGDDGVMVIDTTATPVMAQDLIRRIREVTDKPIKYVVLTHYHAVRVLGASAYGAQQVIASKGTLEMIRERGAQDMQSEIERFPRLFQALESIPGLTWPTLVFDNELTLWMGKLEVCIQHLGRGHTKGDAVVWLPQSKILFSGDLVEFAATPYCGDAHLADWPATLDRLRDLKPEQLVPGRGDALTTPERVEAGISGTQSFVTQLLASAKQGVAAGKALKQVYQEANAKLEPQFGQWVIFAHCMPFNATRAFDEASGIGHPRIWTAERDIEMWKTLEG
jgi:glyoxylase-like metal-dependent hydrolase (beta-lactamase superfamily II)